MSGQTKMRPTDFVQSLARWPNYSNSDMRKIR